MPATKITDLLPIPEGTRQPHAYQVFGLEDGEQNSAKIAEAIKLTIARLKASKGSTDAKLWAKAAKLAQDARVVLADPAKKSQLDARFGIISIEDEIPPPQSQPAVPQAVDPLAGVLPSTDPLAAVLPPTNPLAPATPAAAPAPIPQVPLPDNVMPPGVFGTPAKDANVAGPASVAPVVVKPKKTKRRKSSMVTTLMFSTFAIGMLALIGALIYFLIWGPGELAITKSGGELKITTKPVENNGTPLVSRPHPPSEQAQRPPVDPVMGDLAGDMPPPTHPKQPSGLATALQSSNPSKAPESSPMDNRPDQPQPAMEPMTDEMIAGSEKALDRVRASIREAKWGEMKVAAESLLEMRMTQEQEAEAEALYELADLATYYRGAIERAVAELNVGNDFAVTDTFRVIIVEKGENLLVVRYNEKNRSFTFDEFPFSLAHRLATFSTPGDSATTQAAKAAYQAIAPIATVAHREEAIVWLREITGEVQGADPKRVADTIKSLFGQDA